MTEQPQAPAQVPATFDPGQQLASMPDIPDEFMVGLEQFDNDDIVTPRLTIKHRDGQFEDSLTNTRFGPLNCIILGFVKQRILWPASKADEDVPMCRSNDHDHGYPLMDIQGKRSDKIFPWDRSGFDPSSLTPNENGAVIVNCEGCRLKDWGSHPLGDKPWCNETYTMAVLYDPTSSGDWVPAIISFSKTALKPLKQYMSAFKRSSRPMFTVFTTIHLSITGQGDNVWSVPRFVMGSQTSPDDWRSWASNARQMQAFLMEPPNERFESNQQPAVQQPAWQGNPQASQNPYGQQPQNGYPTQQHDPYSQPPSQQPYGQQQPQQQGYREPPAQPYQQPVQQQAPAPQQTVQQASPPPQQPVQQAPVQQAATAPSTVAAPASAPSGPPTTQAAPPPQSTAGSPWDNANPWDEPAQQPQVSQPAQQAPLQEVSPNQGQPPQQPAAADDPLPF